VCFRFPPLAIAAFFPLVLCLPSQSVWGQWYVDNQASTVGESYARGMSDMVRSAGAANLMNSEAAGNYEAARSQYLDNRMQATDTYFQMRAKNKAYRAAEDGPRPTSEQLFRMAKAKAPSRLSPSELDPISGSVVWPTVLRDAKFSSTQEKLSAMLAYWAEHNHQLTLNQFEQLDSTIDQLTEELKKVVKDVPPNVYNAGRRFLSSLAYEMQISQG
jgi:hypothetical protein